jgi:hypothetical protein
MLPMRCTCCTVGTGFKEFRSSSGVEREVRMEDDGCVNVARINRGRVCM